MKDFGNIYVFYFFTTCSLIHFFGTVYFENLVLFDFLYQAAGHKIDIIKEVWVHCRQRLVTGDGKVDKMQVFLRKHSQMTPSEL